MAYSTMKYNAVVSTFRIKDIVGELNKRPMKILEFSTPKEGFVQKRFLRGTH